METTLLHIDKRKDATFINITNLGIAVKARAGSWTVFSPDLKVLGYSNKSRSEALKDFEVNLTAFFAYHIKEKSIDRVLEKFNWKKQGAFIPFISSKRPKFEKKSEPVLDPRNYEFSVAA